MAPALGGLRVLELAEGIAGQYLGQLLADQGADVLKIEPPQGSRFRGRPQFHVWNRGKRSAVAELESGRGLDLVRELAKRADVLIADFRPSERSPLDPDSLRGANPALIYVWLPPYGEHGEYSDLPADEALADALGGNFAGQPSESGDPVFVVLPLAAYTAALLAASATTAALLARQRDGEGQTVTVPWLAGALAVHTGALVRAAEYVSPMAAAARARKPQGALGAYKLYSASDDWLFVACGHNAFFNKLCIALDRPDLAADERFSQAPWGITKAEDIQALVDEIAPIIASRPRDYWLKRLAELDVPCAPVLSRREYMDDPQLLHNGLRADVDDPELGRVIMTRSPIGLSLTPPPEVRPAPRAGEHTATALQSWPVRGERREGAGAESRPPLAGICIVDLTSYIAGSLCPMILSDYGADVIKVESLTGDAFRAFGLGFLGWNRGKRAIALDLKADEGREVLHRLVKTADVVVENYRAGVAARIGADYETLRALNPRLVYCTIAGWGESGPRADQPAFDPLFQARSGAQRAQGGDDEPIFLAAAITDYAAAHLAAYAVTAALCVRERTGQGQKALITLTGATTAMQSGEFIFPAEGGDFGHAVKGGKDFPGPSAAYRCYPCREGWLFIACTSEEHWRALAKAIGRPELAYENSWPAAACTGPRGGVAAVIIDMLSEDSARGWFRRLSARGVPCAPIVPMQEVLDHPQTRANGLIVEHRHPRWGPVTQTGVLAALSRTPGRSQRPAPELGEHTDEILRDLGYSEPSIASLRQQRVVL